jgi:hypothetical protein
VVLDTAPTRKTRDQTLADHTPRFVLHIPASNSCLNTVERWLGEPEIFGSRCSRVSAPPSVATAWFATERALRSRMATTLGSQPALSAADPVRHESALLYPQHSWEELGGRFLGLMAYLDPKGEGDKSMPGKQRSCPGVRV